MSHDPNCAVVRSGDLRAWCDCPYGGNKIPANYLAKFLPSQGQDTHEDMPWELRALLDNLGPDAHANEKDGDDDT